MRILFLYLFLLFGFIVQGQSVVGYVQDKDTKKPLQGVTIVDKNTRKWAVSGEKGEFSINLGLDYELIFSLLGKEDFVLLPKDYVPGMVVFMVEKTLHLDDVEVVATQQTSDKTSSAIVLDKYAVSQFQSFSVSDVLQQLPGQVISQPLLHRPNTITMRTAIQSNDNAFGVGFILDDMPLSNDENMQNYRYNINSTSFSSNVNSGIDLRSIPSSNIEKVEIIAGVPDAKYGNVTTGVVLIERKAGVHPLQATASMLGGGNSLSLNKGFKLSEKGGNLSLSLDYLNANADPRNNLNGYDRITGSSIWSYFSKDTNFKNTLSITFRSNIDVAKSDKEQAQGYRDASQKKDIGGIVNNRLSWQFIDRWIEQLSLTMGVAYSKSEDIRETFLNSGGTVVATATETELKQGLYTPVAYKSVIQTKGEPLNVNALASVSKNVRFANVSNLLTLGTSFNYSHNLGQGRVFDSSSAYAIGTVSISSPSREGTRPLNFKRTVIPSKLWSVYLQNNIGFAFENKHSLDANIGFRYENMNGFSTLSPRLNTSYRFSPKMRIRAAMGLTTKSPSLTNMFPGDVFFDVLLTDIRTNTYSFNLIQTFVEPRPQVKLKAMKQWKYEIGMDLDLSFATINMSAYLNQTKDGFASENIYKQYQLPMVSIALPSSPLALPTYQITGYENIVRSYSSATNAQSITDKGVDLMLRFHKIKKINTQFSLMGSYVYSKSITNLPNIIQTTNQTEQEYVYGYYQRNPTKNDNFSLRLTASHHIAPLGLLISLTAEQFVFSTSYASIRNIYPYGYMNNQLQYFPISPENVTEARYQGLVLAESSVQDSRTPLYHNFHLRITKEMISGLQISVYATNFLNYRPKVIVNNYTYYKNNPISFGGNIKYVF